MEENYGSCLHLSVRPPTSFILDIYQLALLRFISRLCFSELQRLWDDFELLTAHRWLHKSSGLCLHSLLRPSPVHSTPPNHHVGFKQANICNHPRRLVLLCKNCELFEYVC